MKRARFITLAGLLLGAAPFASPALAETRSPVLLELFTSQGCSSCPNANENAAAIAESGKATVLTFAVDYWDYLGWRDTFARPEFTDRQRIYAQKLRSPVYTPQTVLNGRRHISGARKSALQDALAATAKQAPSGPAIRMSQSGRVEISAAPAPMDGAEVWIASYAPGERMVPVRAGENAGRTIRHYNVVSQIQPMGPWTGNARTLGGEACEIACVVMVQARKSGEILSFLDYRSPVPVRSAQR